MRCKPGDMALVVKSNAGNEGKMVEVKEWWEEGTCPDSAGGWNLHTGWRCEGEGLKVVWDDNTTSPVTSTVFPDAWLLPIRPLDEPDEAETVTELEDTVPA